MGMYDTVNFQMDCPLCGKRMTSFQSKSGACCLEELEITDVDNFYDICDNCKAWVEYTRKDGSLADTRKTLAEAKELIQGVLEELSVVDEVSFSLEEDLKKFLEAHPVPRFALDDFVMKVEASEERDARIKKQNEEWIESLPRGKPYIHFTPEEIAELEDEDEKE